MTISKLTTVLTQSSRCFLPIDDPDQKTFCDSAEMVFHSAGMKTNRAGTTLDSQVPLRLPVFTMKQFNLNKRYNLAGPVRTQCL